MSQPAADPLWWADPALKPRIQSDPVGVLRGYGVNVADSTPVQAVLDVLRLVSVVWVDGQLVSRNRFHLDPFDEGLVYGRGAWEATRTVGGVPWLWAEHLDRLRHTAGLLDIDLTPHRLPDAAEVARFVGLLTIADVVVRLNVSAGRPGLKGRLWMTASLRTAPRTAVKLQTLRSPVPPGHPDLAWKSFQYAGRYRVAQAACRQGFDGALLTDAAGNVLESDCANIFLRFADGWVTPAADADLFLPGTVRNHILRHQPIAVREAAVPAARLPEAEEAFLTNSNLGAVAVGRIDGRELPMGRDTLAVVRWLTPATGGNQGRV
jgi:branched-subunit amino acid aminotransferase/4-amino-4-deoxychorismate lyase